MAVYAHYCLQKLRILPRQFDEMDSREKAFIIASIKCKIESEKQEAKKVKSARKK